MFDRFMTRNFWENDDYPLPRSDYDPIAEQAFVLAASSEEATPEKCCDAVYNAVFEYAIEHPIHYRNNYIYDEDEDDEDYYVPKPMPAKDYLAAYAALKAAYKQARKGLRVKQALDNAERARCEADVFLEKRYSQLIENIYSFIYDDYFYDDEDYSQREDEDVSVPIDAVEAFSNYSPFGHETNGLQLDDFVENSPIFDDVIYVQIKLETENAHIGFARYYSSAIDDLEEQLRYLEQKVSKGSWATAEPWKAREEAKYARSEADKDRAYLARVQTRSNTQEIERARAALERGERYAANMEARLKEAEERYQLAKAEASVAKAEASIANAEASIIKRQLRELERAQFKEVFYAPGADVMERHLYNLGMAFARQYPKSGRHILLRAFNEAYYGEANPLRFVTFYGHDAVTKEGAHTAVSYGRQVRMLHQCLTVAFDVYDPHAIPDEEEFLANQLEYLISEENRRKSEEENDWSDPYDYCYRRPESQPYYSRIDFVASAENANVRANLLDKTARDLAYATYQRAVQRNLHRVFQGLIL